MCLYCLLLALDCAAGDVLLEKKNQIFYANFLAAALFRDRARLRMNETFYCTAESNWRSKMEAKMLRIWYTAVQFENT